MYCKVVGKVDWIAKKGRYCNKVDLIQMNDFMSCKNRYIFCLRFSPLVLNSIIVSSLCSSFEKNLRNTYSTCSWNVFTNFESTNSGFSYDFLLCNQDINCLFPQKTLCRKQNFFCEKKNCEFVDSEFVKICHKQVNYNHF